MQLDAKTTTTILDILSFSRPVFAFICMPYLLNPSHHGLMLVIAVVTAGLIVHFITTASPLRHQGKDSFRAIVDSASESIFLFAMYIALMLAGWFPIWALFICYAGDLLVPYLCVLARQRELNIVYRPSLSVRTAIHSAVQVALILPHVLGDAALSEIALSIRYWLSCLAVAVTVGTVIDYSLAILRPRTKI